MAAHQSSLKKKNCIKVLEQYRRKENISNEKIKEFAYPIPIDCNIGNIGKLIKISDLQSTTAYH